MGRAVLFATLLLGVVSANAFPKIEPNDLLNIGADVDVKSNVSKSGRSDDSWEDIIEGYIKSNDVSFSLPVIGSRITMAARNLDSDELNIKLDFGTGSDDKARGKKSKLKKIFVPILVFILVKAMTLIPLALGILGIKTWNAIQLSFVAFVTALGMAVWKLCSKVQHRPPQIVHSAWDPHHHDRSDVAQQMAYSAFAPQR